MIKTTDILDQFDFDFNAYNELLITLENNPGDLDLRNTLKE